MGKGIVPLSNDLIGSLVSHFDGEISAGMLVFALGLPANTIGIAIAIDPVGQFEFDLLLKIDHPDIPEVAPGCGLPEVRPLIESELVPGSNEHTFRFVRWEIYDWSRD